jgi:uncharacterized protein DUF4386
MASRRRQARLAGLLYVFMIVTGLPGLILIPSRLIVHGDAAATAEHLRASETLFRVGIASELFHQIVFLYVALALYRLLAPVSKNLATQMAALVLVSVPIMFVNAVNELAALVLVRAPSYLTAAFTQAQLDAQAFFFLRLHGEGIGVVEVFWGLWLIPFGLLVYRSGFLPKALGVLLLVAAVGELLRPVVSLFPSLSFLDPVASILALGELPIVLWLAVVGARE